LWSEVLGLYLVVRGAFLQAETPEGQLLLTPEQSAAARRRAEEAQRRAEEEREREADARRRADADVEQLRRELARYTSRRKGATAREP
jgi:hypothetical protein